MIEVTVSYNLDSKKGQRTFFVPDVEIARSLARGLMASNIEQFSFRACGWYLIRSNGRDEWIKDCLPDFD